MVRTEKYQFSSGKNPKGFGCWVFAPRGEDSQSLWFFVSANYAEAKKMAIKHFRGLGYIDLEVLP